MPRNLLLVTLDTTRADRLGAYGGSVDVSPNFDALAREGALFESAYAPVPLTLPTHATLLTGLEPPAHGIRLNGQVLPPDVATVAQMLSSAGFATGAVLGSSILGESAGLARGFEVYDAPALLDSGGARTADDAASRAVGWLAGVPAERRFFLWVHFFDPHDPYLPPPPWDARFRGREYEGEIAFADEQLGRLLDALRRAGRLGETLVCVAADHGESLGEHGEATHGILLYESTTHVPLLLRHPGTVPVARVRGIARLVDLPPTLLALLGLPAPSEFQGESLAPFLGTGWIEPPLPAYLESDALVFRGGAPLRAIRTHEWKFIRAPRPELYRPGEDPSETRNLLDGHPEAARSLDRQLASLEGRIGERARIAPEDEEAHPALVALGYAANPLPEGSVSGLDPKDFFLLLETVSRSVSSIESGRPEEEVLSRIEGAFPGPSEQGVAIFHVALELSGRKRSDVAGRWVARALRLRPDLAAAHLLEARLAAEDDPARAEALLRETVRRFPTFVEAKLWLARLLFDLSGNPEAEPLLREVVRDRPNAFAAWETLGRLLALDPSRRAEAIDALRRAVRFGPEPGPSRALLEHLTGAPATQASPCR